MKIVNEWFPAGKFRKVYTPFITDSTYKKELMSTPQFLINALHKEEIGYHWKFGHNLGMIQHISLMSTIEICYGNCCLST